MIRLWAWLMWRAGLTRLQHGYCPACNSSPPRPDCPLCEGEHYYGDDLAAYRRRLWRHRWDSIPRVI